MVLKLFTPAQANKISQERMARDSQRAQTLSDLTSELLKTRAEAERDFEDSMRRQRELNEKEYDAHLTRMKTLEREVQGLERRKKAALMPLVEREQAVHLQEEALKEARVRFEKDRVELEDISRTLMRRLDECSSREQDITDREQRVRTMESGAAQQREVVIKGQKQLNVTMAEFYQLVADKETQFAFRNSELDARKNLYDEKEKALTERDNALHGERRYLFSQREILSKGFDRLKHLQTYGQ